MTKALPELHEALVVFEVRAPLSFVRPAGVELMHVIPERLRELHRVAVAVGVHTHALGSRDRTPVTPGIGTQLLDGELGHGSTISDIRGAYRTYKIDCMLYYIV